MFARRVILIYIFFLLTLFGLFATIWFFYQKTNHEKKSIEILKAKIQHTQESLIKIENFQKKYGQLADATDEINQILPDQSNIPEVLVQLEDLASQNSLFLFDANIREKSLSEVKKKLLIKKQNTSAFYSKGIHSVYFNINLYGSYEDFKNFLKALEKNLRIMDVKKITYSVDTIKDALKINLEIETYYSAD